MYNNRSTTADANTVPKAVSEPQPERKMRPKITVTFIDQEEYNNRNYKNGKFGGYINNLLIAANVEEIHESDDDDINFEYFSEQPYSLYKAQNKCYVVAPDGYYWKLNHIVCCGHVYELEKNN